MTASNNSQDAQQIIVDPKQTTLRLDKFLTTKLANTSRTNIQSSIKQGAIQVNDKPIKPSYYIKPQDIITINLPKPTSNLTILPEDIPLDILYEDEAIIIVNKPAEMVVHPACENWTGTLVNALLYRYSHLPTEPENEVRPGLVHRIDKGTSGLIIIARTQQSKLNLSKQLSLHTIERKYIALVWGILQNEEGTINIPLKRSPKDRRIIQADTASTPQSKHAITHYKVLKRLQYVTLITCRLETGRTHQIRAHMKHLQHPLFGDTRYGGNQIIQGPKFSKYKTFVNNCFKTLPHQALHAYTLTFTHPTTKKKMHFQAPIPTAFQTVIHKWERFVNAN